MKSIIAVFLISLLLILCCANKVFAKDKHFYSVISGGYAINDLDGESLEEPSYKIGIGYVLSKQWSIEAGFQDLGENRMSIDALTLNNANQHANATYISALGRAGNRQGELFYRVGLLRTNISKDYLHAGSECDEGGNRLGQKDSLLVCQLSDSKIAGVIGIGFDFYIHHSTLLRIEIEHIQGQDGFSSQAAYIGFRLNF